MAKKMIYCPHCGEKINKKTKKCPYCGGRIKKNIFLRLLSFLGSIILTIVILFVLVTAIHIGGNIVRHNFPDTYYAITRKPTPTPWVGYVPAHSTPTPIPASTPTPLPIIFGETDVETIEQEQPAAEPSGIRPGFKEFWDSYEAFYMEYCDYMENIGTSSDLSMMGDYLSLMNRAQEMDEAAKQWNDEEDMTSEEYAYFWGVNSRVMTRLAEVGEG